MSRDERQAFLADLHVGVLSVAGGDGLGPLTMPMWYLYEPGGDVTFITGGGSRKMRLLRDAGRCTLCVQTESVPYKYVTVEGPVVAIDGSSLESERRALALRYLGAGRAERYLAATAAESSGSVVVRLSPERWLSADFGRR